MSTQSRVDHRQPEQETHEHIVQWVTEMYRRGRDPLKSIDSQASLTRGNAKSIKMDVLVACRPGGTRDLEAETAKKKYTRQWREQNR